MATFFYLYNFALMVLVTGGTGLVGSHLLYQLSEKNNKIIAIYRKKEKIEEVKKVFSFYTPDITLLFSKIKWVKADITDVSSLEDVFSLNPISFVYHCAALVSFSPTDYKKMRKTNIEGTANVVNMCIAYNVDKICYTSSVATLGGVANNKLINEENFWSENNRRNEYAITKNGAEMEVWRASQEGVDVVIVNPGIILGSGFYNSESGKIFSKTYNGFPFYTEGITGYVGVKDVARAMISLTKSDIKDKRFILVAQNESLKNILFKIADSFGKKRPFIKINSFVTSIVWRADWFLSVLTNKKRVLSKYAAKSLHNENSFSSEKIKNQLNFKFEKIDSVISTACKNYPEH